MSYFLQQTSELLSTISSLETQSNSSTVELEKNMISNSFLMNVNQIVTVYLVFLIKNIHLFIKLFGFATTVKWMSTG